MFWNFVQVFAVYFKSFCRTKIFPSKLKIIGVTGLMKKGGIKVVYNVADFFNTFMFFEKTREGNL